MERRNAQTVVPLHPAGQQYTLAEEDYETLTEAFQKFNEASVLLQEKYEELQEESAELREQLKRKEEEVKKNERLSTLGETAAALAHEIRNPLGAITLYTSLLQQDLEEQPEQQELVAAIDRSVSALNHVVTNILQFARHQPTSLEPISLQMLLGDLQRELSQCYPNVALGLHTRGDLYVWGDGTGLRQLFYNLLMNAVQAQAEKGRIQVSALGLSEQVIVRVKDFGPGISEEILPEIFEPFMTSKSEGTGLGLAICREIVRTHGATIIAQNWRNGAEFRIQFPRKIETEKGYE